MNPLDKRLIIQFNLIKSSPIWKIIQKNVLKLLAEEEIAMFDIPHN